MEIVEFTILAIGRLKFVHNNSLFKLQVGDSHETNEKCLFLSTSPMKEIKKVFNSLVIGCLKYVRKKLPFHFIY
jgi:hypothetical protein